MATRAAAFPSQYIGKDDVHTPIQATIKRVVGESVGQGPEAEERRIAYFVESGVKPMILNSGNWQTIEAISGQSDDDNWGGTRIEIYVDPTVSFGGKRVGGLRVREPNGNGYPPAPPHAPIRPDQAAALKKAKADAWAAFCAKHPDVDEKTRMAYLARDVHNYFGREISTLGANDWITFRVNDFTKPLAAFDGDVIPDEGGPVDCPF